jgi:hypothetical protein
VQIAYRFPPLTKANFLARSAARLGLSEKLLLALVDSHTALDALEIYQTLQKLRHQAGRPAPSLMTVRNGLDDLLRTHGNIIAARFDSPQALADLLSAVKHSIERTHERVPLNVFFSLLNAWRSPVDQAVARAHGKIRTISDALQRRPDDVSEIERLAGKCRARASLADALPLLEHAELHDGQNVVWEHIGALLKFLIEGQHFQSAQKVVDVITEAFRPFEDRHFRSVALLTPFQQQIVSLAGEMDRAEKDRAQGHSKTRPPRRRGLARVTMGLIIVGGLAIVFLRVHDAPSRAEVNPAAGGSAIRWNTSAIAIFRKNACAS